MLRRFTAVTAGVVTVLLAAAPLAGAVHPRTSPTLDGPDAIAAAGGTIWVANGTGNSVVGFNATTGTQTHLVEGAHTGIKSPNAIVAAGATVVVASAPGTITELSSTGVVTHVINAAADHLTGADALAYDAPDVWVADGGANALTELNATTGKLVRLVANTSFRAVAFDDPVAVAVSDNHLWVANDGDNSLTEVNATTGAVMRVLSSSAYQFDDPAGVAITDNQVWVTNPSLTQVTVVNAATGALVQLINNGSNDGGYGFNAPGPIFASASYVYVASPPGGSPMVTQIAPATGDADWMMCNTNYAFNFLNPAGLTISGANLYVANQANNTVTELNASTGVLVQDFS